MVSRNAPGFFGRQACWRFCLIAAFACPLAACVNTGVDSEYAAVSLSALDGARFRWVQTRCVDGRLDLAPLGFERELFTEVRNNRVMMSFDTRIARDECEALLVWEARYDANRGLWEFLSPGRTSLPVGETCGVDETSVRAGMLGLSGDDLEVLTFRSPWCRGFDARAVYRRVQPRRLPDRDQIRRYYAHFNRRDPDALARLFADRGVLIEPFSKTPDGAMMRHTGREAIASWYARAFASTGWSGVRLRDLYLAGDDGTWVARWDYMDGVLAEPLEGRNLFLLAGGEIFMTEVQLVSAAKPAPP
ncbi:MAG: nuclear transport factor 2 family protein [Myxococcales bacterium]|nr:nuclear transport factor 2 family protein [Myxococcales bacterium]